MSRTLLLLALLGLAGCVAAPGAPSNGGNIYGGTDPTPGQPDDND